MSTKRIITVVVEDGDVEKFKKSLKETGYELNDVDKKVKKVSKSTKDEFRGSQAAADRLSGGVGGVGEQLVIVAKAAKKGGAAMKSAMVATGVGALIVALGFVADHWEEIVNFIIGANNHLKEQRILLENNAKLLEAQVKSIKAEKALRVARGKGIDDLLLKEKALLKARIANRKEVFRTRKAELELAAQRFNEITATEEFLQLFGVDARTQEDLDKIKELKAAAFEAKAAVKEAEKDLQDLENDIFDANALVIDPNKKEPLTQRREKLEGIETIDSTDIDNRVQKEVEAFERIFEVKKNNDERLKELSKETNAELLNDARILEVVKRAEDTKTNEAIEASRIRNLQLEKAASQAKLDIAANTFALIGSIVEEGSALGKGVAIAQTVINGIEGVQAAFTTANKSPITAVFPAYPTIQAGLAAAFSAVQVGKILSTDPTGQTTPNLGGGLGGGVQAPSFNVVGQSGVNQLADTLNQEQQPIQAFVVGSQVTTQQELDNNIVNTANIG